MAVYPVNETEVKAFPRRTAVTLQQRQCKFSANTPAMMGCGDLEPVVTERTSRGLIGRLNPSERLNPLLAGQVATILVVEARPIMENETVVADAEFRHPYKTPYPRGVRFKGSLNGSNSGCSNRGIRSRSSSSWSNQSSTATPMGAPVGREDIEEKNVSASFWSFAAI